MSYDKCPRCLSEWNAGTTLCSATCGMRIGSFRRFLSEDGSEGIRAMSVNYMAGDYTVHIIDDTIRIFPKNAFTHIIIDLPFSLAFILTGDRINKLLPLL